MTQQAHEEEKKRMITLLRKEYGDDVWFGSTKCGVDSAYTKLIDIETAVDYLLSNGTIMPPCKVGDTVYVITNGKIREIVVDVISWTGFLFTFHDDRVYVDERQAYYTREAAEQALKERNQHE